jgi:hypothetical protein
MGVGMVAAFNDDLVPSDELREVVEIFLKKTKLQNVEDAINKFIRIPKTAKLLWGEKPPSLEDQQQTMSKRCRRNISYYFLTNGLLYLSFIFVFSSNYVIQKYILDFVPPPHTTIVLIPIYVYDHSIKK